MTRQAQRGRLGPGTRFRRGLFILIIALLGDSTTLWAQARPVPMTSVGAANAADPEASAVRLLVGRSTVIDIGSPITRVSLTSADIADAMVTSPNQLLLNGKMPGTISLFVWDRAGAIRRYEVIVQRDLSHLTDHMRQLFPGEPITVQSTGRSIVLSGAVSSKDVIDKSVDLAGGYVEKKDEVVHLLKTRGMFQSLAEPNLVAESGKEASFLAGGEFPIPIAQPSTNGVSIVVTFKEFGVRLNFTPTIVGDRIHLKVKPEVSTLDFANAVSLQGFRIP